MTGNSINMDFIINEILPFVKQHPILTLLWFIILGMIINLSIKIKLSKVKSISNSLAVQLINKQNAVVVDLRSADNFRKGHITDAINILPIDIKNGSTKAIEKFKDLPIILVDNDGLKTTESGEILFRHGFSQIFTLKDGIMGWHGENLPLIK